MLGTNGSLELSFEFGSESAPQQNPIGTPKQRRKSASPAQQRKSASPGRAITGGDFSRADSYENFDRAEGAREQSICSFDSKWRTDFRFETRSKARISKIWDRDFFEILFFHLLEFQMATKPKFL